MEKMNKSLHSSRETLLVIILSLKKLRDSLADDESKHRSKDDHNMYH